MANLQQAKTLSEIIGTWVTIAGAFVAGIIALLGYSRHVADSRVAETLKYVERFQKPPVFDARSRIHKAWYTRLDEVDKILTSSEKYDAEEIVDELNRFVIKLVESNELQVDLLLLVDFFESIVICYKGKICDRDVATSFFYSHAHLSWNRHGPYINYLRDRLNDERIAQGFEEFVRGQEQ